MRRRTTALVLVLLTALAAGPAGAQQDPKSGGGTGPGQDHGTIATPRGNLRIFGRVWVGDQAPDFELDGTLGAPVSLRKQRGEWVLLVFARDKSLFDALSSLPPEMAKVGAKMFGITRERVSSLRAYATRQELSFELLSDPTGDISAVYGSFDSETNATRPGYVLLDRRGVVKLSVIGQTFPPEQVLTLVSLTIQAQ